MSDPTQGTRMVVSGNPTAEELAAIVVVLDEVLRRQQAPAAPRLAWQVAARYEATGHRAVASPWELPPA